MNLATLMQCDVVPNVGRMPHGCGGGGGGKGEGTISVLRGAIQVILYVQSVLY